MELKTAKEWRIPPDEWDAMDGETKAWMMAYDQAEGRMGAWEVEMERRKQARRPQHNQMAW